MDATDPTVPCRASTSRASSSRSVNGPNETTTTIVNSTTRGKCAFDWDIYKSRRLALQHLKRNRTLTDTVLVAAEDGGYEFVHSQVVSALSEKLAKLIADCDVYVHVSSNEHLDRSHTLARTAAANANSNIDNDDSESRPRRPANLRCKLVRLEKFNQNLLQLLIDCSYTGYIQTDVNGIWQVLEVADCYEMSDVLRACCTFLIEYLDVDNCIHYYHIGARYKHSLQRHAFDVIRNNFKYLLHNQSQSLLSLHHSSSGSMGTSTGSLLQPTTKSVQNQTLSQNNQPVVHNNSQQQQQQSNDWLSTSVLESIPLDHYESLLAHDRLNIDCEEEVWFAIRLWCHDYAERRKHVTRLLSCIRFGRLHGGPEFCTNVIWKDRLIVENKHAQQQLALLDRNYRDILVETSSLINWTSANSTGNSNQQATSASAHHTNGRQAVKSLLLSAPAIEHHQSIVDDSTHSPLAAPLIAAGSYRRDGYQLPCAMSPRQIRPRVPNSVLLAIGGWQSGVPSHMIESYDVNCNLWFALTNKRILCELAYHGIEIINQKLYICGGTDGTEILNELFMFDPIAGQCYQRANMNEPRCYVSTATLDVVTANGDKTGCTLLYALGGHNGISRMRSCESYNPQSNLWSNISDMNVARSDASACAHDNFIYIAGGLNDQVIENSCEFYNPMDKTWTFIASMTTPRTSFTMLHYEDSLLAIGGNNGQERLSSVEKYTFKTNRWSSHSQMRHRRSTFSAAILDAKLVVVGGYNGQTPFNKVECYDSSSGTWNPVRSIRYDRSGLKCVVVNNLPNSDEYSFIGNSTQL